MSKTKTYFHEKHTIVDVHLCENFIHWIFSMCEEFTDEDGIDWYSISASKNVDITMNVLIKYKQLPWNYSNISYSGKITIEFVKDNYDKFKDYIYTDVFNNIHLSKKDLFEYIDFIKTLDTTTNEVWEKIWSSILYKGSLSHEFFLKYKNEIKKYNYNHLNIDFIEKKLMMQEQNENIQLEYIETFIENNTLTNDDYIILSQTEIITMDFVDKHIEKPWNFALLAKHKNMTIEFAIKHYERLKDYNCIVLRNLSKNPSISLENIESTIGLIQLNEEGIWSNPNMTMSFVRKYKDIFQLERYIEYLSMNPNIKMKDIYNNLDLEWSFPRHLNYMSVLENPNFDFITFVKDKRFKKLPINVQKNIKAYFNFNEFDGVGFSHIERRWFFQKELTKAALKIQTQWRQCWYNPRYAVCKKRLTNEYNELMEEYTQLRKQ